MELNGLIMIYPMIIFLYLITIPVAAYYASATLQRSFKNWLIIGALLPFVSIFLLVGITFFQKKTN